MDKVEAIHHQLRQFEILDMNSLEHFRQTFLSKKGLITGLFDEIKQIEPSQRKSFGAMVNHLRQEAEEKYEQAFGLYFKDPHDEHEKINDPHLQSQTHILGSIHPITITRNRIVEIFRNLGFRLSEGPEVENDWYNFSALNFPEDHPARDMQDTFFLNKSLALRTHTSSVQVRLMEQGNLPIRHIMPGRVYRNEAISARAHCFFHQIEGLVVDTQTTFADLRKTLFDFVKEFFGENVSIRFRPSYFPFTEPSAEMDISCQICNGVGCAVCKHTGWVEILGCGMIDPHVLEACGVDPEKYQGYAFGMGIERITMLEYRIHDLRIFSENDQRFLNQFIE